jgi:hypothetical protein
MAEPGAQQSAARTPTASAKLKAGVPVWRVGKPDAFLAAAADTARAALADIARPEDIGGHIAAKSEGERVVTHLFECRLRGYRGWQWFATLARVARSKAATVSEIGLVPSQDSILAPEWVPWSERVRPEDSHTAGPEAAPGEQAHDGAPAASADGSPKSPEEPERREEPESPEEQGPEEPEAPGNDATGETSGEASGEDAQS